MVIGNAPCSWGVFYAKGNRIDGLTYLDSLVRAGYRATELGPLGFLPGLDEGLADLLAARDLSLTGASHVHEFGRGAESWPELRAALNQLGPLLAELRAPHLIVMDESAWYPPGGARRWDELQWGEAMRLIRRAQRHCEAEFGLALHFHPHVGTAIEFGEQIDRLLQDTSVSLCLDTGHHALWDPEPLDFLRQRWGRVAYLHLKNVDVRLREQVLAGALSIDASFEAGLMCPLDEGMVNLAALMDFLRQAKYAGVCIIEQDPRPGDSPADCEALALRNRLFLESLT